MQQCKILTVHMSSSKWRNGKFLLHLMYLLLLLIVFAIYASANVVAIGIMFPECSCMLESRTSIVSKISWVFVDRIRPNFFH